MRIISGVWVAAFDYAKEMEQALEQIENLLSIRMPAKMTKEERVKWGKAAKWRAYTKKMLKKRKAGMVASAGDTMFQSVAPPMGEGLDALIPPLDPHRQTGV